MDDGSTDGTAEAIRSEFPSAVVHRSGVSTGYIIQRNRGAELAKSDCIFSIDDDAAYPSNFTVEQTLADFDDSRIAAVAIPFIDVNYGPRVKQQSPDGGGVHVISAFVGTAYAIRREAFLQCGGFCEAYHHQVEEHDLCAKLLARGLFVRMGNADPIHHFESPVRDTSRIRLHNARNHILFAWQHVPTTRLGVHWGGNVLNLLRHGRSQGCTARVVRGLARGFADAAKGSVQRRPLSGANYRLLRRLKRGSLPLEEAAAAWLPPRVDP